MVIGRHVTFHEKSVLNRPKADETLNSEAEIEFESNPDLECSEHESIAESEGEFNDTLDQNANLDDIGDFKDNNHSIELDNAGSSNSHDTIGNCIGACKDNNHSANTDSIGDNGEQLLRRSERERRAPQRFGEWASNIAAQPNELFALCAQQFVENDPQSIEEAKQREDWPEWQKSIETEYESLIKNETWSLCDLPKNRKAISGKWVFKLKRKFNGEVDKYKARFVAKGFSQKQGFDFNETYAPVAKLPTLRILRM